MFIRDVLTRMIFCKKNRQAEIKISLPFLLRFVKMSRFLLHKNTFNNFVGVFKNIFI